MTRGYQGTAAWLEERKGGIGASEAPVLVNGTAEDWRTLFAIKLGLLPDTEGTEAMKIGLALEPVIAGLYTERTGQKTQRVHRILRHREHDEIRASLDRRRAGAVVELKARGFRTDDWGPDGSDQVPDGIVYQVTQQMAVAGVSQADVAVLFAGREFRNYRLGYDRDLGDRLVGLGVAAWAWVARGEMPPYPGPTPIHPRLADDEIDADEALVALLAEHQLLEGALEGLTVRVDAAKAAIREQLATAGGARALLPDGTPVKVSFRPNKDKVKVDHEALAAAFRHRLLQRRDDPAELAKIEQLFTTTSPGARPLLIRTMKEVGHGLVA